MKTKHWIILLLLSISASSCDRRCEVTKTDRAMIPYQIGDTVRFTDRSGNPNTFVVIDEISWWDHWDEHFYDEYLKVILKSIHTDYQRNDSLITVTIHGWNDPNRRSLDFWLYGYSKGAGGIIYYNSKGKLLSSEDSVFIGKRWYYNVANASSPNDIYGPAEGFYNKTHGVLKLIKNEREILTLDTIIRAGKR